MRESAEMLLKKMGEDKSFAEKILSQTEKEEVIEIAKGEGIELTMEDIGEINEAIAKVLQQKNEGELSEEELENVAGGLVLSAVITSATQVFLEVGSAVGSAIISGVKSAIASFMSGKY